MMLGRSSAPTGLFAPLLATAAVLVFALPASGAGFVGKASGLIAFTRGGHAYVMNADGSGVRAVACDGVNDVAWSPDGGKLACGGPTGIMVVNADGSGTTRVSAHHVLSLSWSPDGRRIAFSAQLGRGRVVIDIAVMNADGSNVRRLTHTPKLWENNVAWSPAGGLIAFDRGSGFEPGHVCIMKTDGSGLNDLNPTTKTRYQPGPYPVYSEEPDWSPDGRRIVFSYYDPYYGLSDIWIMNANGKGLVKLTHNWMDDGSPAWSPDGHRIAYVRSARYAKTSEIVVMNADGSGKKALTHADYADRSPAWQPATLVHRGRAAAG